LAVLLPTTKSGDDVKLFVEDNGLQIKVEVNSVFRGTVLPVTRRPLMPIAQELRGAAPGRETQGLQARAVSVSN
jgi:hypothetical protein